MTTHPRTKIGSRRALLATIATILAVLGSACTQAVPSPAPTPSASGTPSLSPDELYAEAERVYRLYFAEVVKLESDGGADELPPMMREYLTGAALESVTKIFRQAKADGIHFGPGEVTRLTATAPLPLDASETDAVVAVQSCNDSTGNSVFNDQGTLIGYGSVAWRKSYFQWDGTQLKIFANRTEGLETCPIN